MDRKQFDLSDHINVTIGYGPLTKKRLWTIYDENTRAIITLRDDELDELIRIKKQQSEGRES